MSQSENLVPFLVPGRMLKIKDFGWGIIVNFTKKNVELSFKNKKKESAFINQMSDQNPNFNLGEKTIETYFIDILLYVKNTLEVDMKLVKGNIDKNDGQMGVVNVFLNSVEEISQVKANIPQDLKSKENIKKVEKLYKEVSRSL